jgi:hypothetical protein
MEEKVISSKESDSSSVSISPHLIHECALSLANILLVNCAACNTAQDGDVLRNALDQGL